jgi:prephenate dehydratase
MTDSDYSPTPPLSFNAAQKPVTFGIQGGEGSFNDEAIQHYLSHNFVPTQAIEYLFTSGRVMEAVVNGEIDRGQCAIYNSVGGYVEETTEALEKFPVKIIQEFEIKIAHALMIRPDQDLSKIDTIMCHPQVLAQCKSNLRKKYPDLIQTSGQGEWVDNAKTAEALSTHRLPDNTAVMGSKVLAKIYHLQVIEDNLQDAEENYTRFIHVVRQ